MRVLDLIYPKKCIFCGSVLAGSCKGVCEDCLSVLPTVKEPMCLRCGKPIADDREALCRDCMARRDASLDGALSLWVYDDMTKAAMVDFKYGGCTVDASFYADEIVRVYADRIYEWAPDVIVSIPIHRRRLMFRGYNQAEILAGELSNRLDIPCTKLLIRDRYTTPLKELSPRERRRTLLKAFMVDDGDDFYGRADTVLLIDDIYTTGATLDACAKLLKDVGVSKVYAVCLCIGSEV